MVLIARGIRKVFKRREVLKDINLYIKHHIKGKAYPICRTPCVVPVGAVLNLPVI